MSIHPANLSQKHGSPKPTALRNATTTSGLRRSIKPEIQVLPAITISAKALSLRWPTTATTTPTSSAGCSRILTSPPAISSRLPTIQPLQRSQPWRRLVATSKRPKFARTPMLTVTALQQISIAAIEPCANQASIPAFASVPLVVRPKTMPPYASIASSTNTSATCPHFATLLGHHAEAVEWEHRATARRAAINKYLWNPTQGMFYDYDFTTQKQSTYSYLTAFYPLWAKLATPQQAAALQVHLSSFEHDGGLAMSDTNSGTQWDLPFGWAPTNWLAIQGLVQYGFSQDAYRIARKFSQTILQKLSKRRHHPREIQRSQWFSERRDRNWIQKQRRRPSDGQTVSTWSCASCSSTSQSVPQTPNRFTKPQLAPTAPSPADATAAAP